MAHPPPVGGAAPIVALASLVLLVVPAPAPAQQAGGEGRACTLVLEPATDSTRSVRVQAGPNRYVTYVGNGLRALCGDARMTADSAVSYGGEQRVRMIGSVRYRDSVRTLTADTLTYFQAEDRVLAVTDVVLVRRASGSRLTGPRVEFLRVRSPEARRTVATGRARLTVFPDSGPADTAAADPAPADTAARERAAGDTTAAAARGTAAGEVPADTTGISPVVVDADRIVMVGEREVRTWGDVRIRRPRVDARADSAFFRLEEGRGRLMGAPAVEGEDFTLTGDTILTGFRPGGLEAVESVGDARATGDDFDLYARRIRARLEDDELQRLWAYGEGRSVAVSAPYRLAADSLDTAFAAGEMDTLYAVGSARAVEIEGAPEGDPRAPVTLAAGERSWITGDTLIFRFAPSEEGAAADTAAAADEVAAADTVVGEEEAAAEDEDGEAEAAAAGRETRLQRVRAAGEARAYHVLEPREAGARPPRDYQLARVIEIFFEDGEVARVVGQRAVGVHLDPIEGGTVRPPPSDTAGAGRRVAPDTAGTEGGRG